MGPSAVRDDLSAEFTHSATDESREFLRSLNDASLDRDLLEPIAIIGLSLKFPQDATSAQLFWEMLMEGRSAMTDVPNDRFNVDSFYSPGTKRQDQLPLRGGHFIKEDIKLFDAGFFNISPAEASAMDPMQRIMLETAYRAFENAGLPLDKIAGSNTSVYTGCFTTDYLLQLMRDPQYLPTYAATGVAASLLANRLSWFFNLKGASVNLDSACSSSGMALDWACSQLRDRSSNMSLVAGCNLTFAPEYFNLLTNLNMLSHSSHSFSFDSRANGYARGEGFGVVILKRLDDAIADGDTIRGVIRSTGCNQDGRTPGITQPSSSAQERLIRETYRKAGLDMSLTRFCEAHGTGTALGDPIESMAIGRSFKDFRTPSSPLIIGALKSNIGHLEGAAGVAGLIKAILCIEKGIIPPNADFKSLNPNIDAEYLCLAFPTTPIPWPTNGLRRASINSFGFGGSNSHVVIDDAYNFLKTRGLKGKHCTATIPPAPETLASESSCRRGNLEARHESQMSAVPYQSRSPRLCVISAASETSLTELTASYAESFKDAFAKGPGTEALLDNVAYTLGSRRTHLSWRSFFLVSSESELQAIDKNASQPRQKNETPPRLGFIFTGQGAQWYGMGRELMEYPIFRESVYKSDVYLRDLGCEWPIFDFFAQTSSSTLDVDIPTISQTLCTVLQVALVDLLEHFGVIPSAVLGHSSGEIAAAYASGGLCKRSALKVAYYRGVLATTLPEKCSYAGGMLAVALSAEQIRPYFDKVCQQEQWGPVIACYNSPQSITVSGTDFQIDSLAALLNEANVFNRKLRVPVAYHSPQMMEISVQYKELLIPLTPGQARRQPVGMVSSVTGEKIAADKLSDADYWVENMVSPVQFSQALEKMCARAPKSLTKKLNQSHRSAIAVDYLLEAGPHGALKGPVRELLRTHPRDAEIAYDSLLARNLSSFDTVLQSVGRLHCSGYNVNLRALNEPNMGPQKPSVTALPDLPQYPFNHSQGYWHESRITSDLKHKNVGHLELLGRQSLDWNPLAPRWRHFLKTKDMPWIEDHKINGVVLYPGAGMLALAIEAARQINLGSHISGYLLKDIVFSAALDVSSGEREAQISLQPRKDFAGPLAHTYEFVISSYSDSEQWIENCRGTICVQLLDRSGSEDDRVLEDGLRLSGNSKIIPVKTYYEFLRECGYGYGKSFQRIGDLKCSNQGEALATISPYQGSSQSHVVHPTTLDAIMHLQFAATSNGCKKRLGTLIPTKIESLWIAATGLGHPLEDSLNVLTKVTSETYRFCKVSVTAQGKGNRDTLRVVGLETTAVSKASNGQPIRSPEEQVLTYMDTKIDIHLATSKQIIDFLSKECPAPPEPTSHHLQLQKDVFQCLREVKRLIGNSMPRDLPQHTAAYLSWMDFQLEQSDKYVTTCTEEGGEERPAEKRLYAEVGQELFNVLNQTTAPTQLLFETGLLGDYYLEKARTEVYITRLLKYIDLLSHRNPAMKIIEVGGGTGTFTGPILDTLNRHSDGEVGVLRCKSYDFTDIGPFFLEQAKEKFGKYSDKMQYGVLDIEKEPSGQGYDEGSYDLVIAISVIHATRSLEESLRNVRKLLKPGGVFLLQEPTTPTNPTTGFVFGILPGWWLGMEPNRKLSPLVDEEMWDTLLRKTGFTGTDIILRDYESDICHEMSFLISRAAESHVEASETPPSARIKLIVQDGSEIQHRLAEQLQEQARLRNQDSDIMTVDEASRYPDPRAHACIFIPELERPFLMTMDEQAYTALKNLLLGSSYILWITRGGGKSLQDPGYAVIDGFARSFRLESSNLKLVSLALEDDGVLNPRQLDSIFLVMRETLQSTMENYEREYIEKDGMLHTNRIVEANELKRDFLERLSQHETVRSVQEATPILLNIDIPGQLDTLHFARDMNAQYVLDEGTVEVEVKAVGLSSPDYFVASGRSKESKFGSECCGVVLGAPLESGFQKGDRVWVHGSGLCRTIVRSPASLIARLPTELSFTQVSALPTGSVAIAYTMHQVVRVRKGDSVLLCCAKSILGAALQIAIAAEVDLYVVAEDDATSHLLSNVYKLPIERIVVGTRFGRSLKRLTQGRGVDVVVNTIREGIDQCFESLSSFGTLADIVDLYEPSAGVRSQPSNSNTTMITVNSMMVARERPHLLTPAIEKVISLAAAGALRPSPRIMEYPVSQVEQAFEQLKVTAEGDKIVLEIDMEDSVKIIQPRKWTYDLPANATYVISGLGGLGRSVARWMASKGAKHLLLLSRSGGQTVEALECISHLRKMGVNVETPVCDVSDLGDVRRTVAKYQSSMPAIRGCIHLSKSGNDALFENMPFSMWRENMGAKADGAWNLHEVLPSGLDFFVMFASIGGVIGSVTLVAYGASNHYLDGLAQYRISLGEKAMAMDYGVAEDDGRLADDQDLFHRFMLEGKYIPMPEYEFLALLDYSCDPNTQLTATRESQPVSGIEAPTRIMANGFELPAAMRQPLWRHMFHVKAADKAHGGPASVADQKQDLAVQLDGAVSIEEAASIVTEALVKRVARTVSIAEEKLDVNRPMHAYGVDSLTAVDLRNWFTNAIHVDVAIFEILGDVSFIDISLLVARKYKNGSYHNKSDAN